MDITRIRMTNAEYLAMPEDGKHYELYEGALVEMPSPTPLHNWIVALLVRVLLNYVLERRLGYVFPDNLDYILEEGVILKPDVSFVAAGRFTTLPQRFQFAPDLAVEVLSPSNSASEIAFKIESFFKHGTRLIWVVDPERRVVTVHRPGDTQEIITRPLSGDDVLTGGNVLPEFRLPLPELFGVVL